MGQAIWLKIQREWKNVHGGKYDEMGHIMGVNEGKEELFLEHLEK